MWQAEKRVAIGPAHVLGGHQRIHHGFFGCFNRGLENGVNFSVWKLWSLGDLFIGHVIGNGGR